MHEECYKYEKEFLEFTGFKQWNAVYTIQLGELIDLGLFDWEKEYLNWEEHAYNTEQYQRLCQYFIDRFMYREISIEPFKEWALTLKRKIIYELMPKYKPLYERYNEGINPLSDENEYYKNRTIDSAYPETLLSNNSDYITDGRDEEFQRIKEGNLVENSNDYADNFRTVDKMICDDLEIMFISMWTANVNSSW